MTMKKVAFCFLIYDEIHHEDLWNVFFSMADRRMFNIYIHYKQNKSLRFLQQYKLTQCIETQWGHVSLVHATNHMFRYAFDHDAENVKFVLLSGACIPLKSFRYVYAMLTNDNMSYFNVCPTAQCFPNCNAMVQRVTNRSAISKAHQWIILNRTLVQKLCIDISKETIDQLCCGVFAPDEIYYITMVRLLRLENHIQTTDNSSTDATTFTNWNDGGLKNYDSISSQEIDHLCLQSRCLFGRKFTQLCSTNLHSHATLLSTIRGQVANK
jgi:hypothetical protein